MTRQAQNPYLDCLIEPRFQKVNRFSNLLFENNEDRTVHTGYFLPKLEDQSIKSDMRTSSNIWKIATDQGDEYTTVCLLNYSYFKESYVMIAIDLSKQQVLDADLKAIQKDNFTGNLAPDAITTMFFINEEAKKKHLFFIRNSEGILISFYLSIISVKNDPI